MTDIVERVARGRNHRSRLTSAKHRAIAERCAAAIAATLPKTRMDWSDWWLPDVPSQDKGE